MNLKLILSVFIKVLKYAILIIALETILFNMLEFIMEDNERAVFMSLSSTILISYLWWFKFLKKKE